MYDGKEYYVPKPIVAERFDDSEVVRKFYHIQKNHYDPLEMLLPTRDDNRRMVKVNEGDWIITDPESCERWVIPDEIFRKMYMQDPERDYRSDYGDEGRTFNE